MSRARGKWERRRAAPVDADAWDAQLKPTLAGFREETRHMSLLHGGLRNMAITEQELEHWFTYHTPCAGQPERYYAVREAAKYFAQVVVQNSLPSADQTAAVRKIREAVMTVNQAIACESAEGSASFVKPPDTEPSER